jgi:AcrR family transcriptional regulator
MNDSKEHIINIAFQLFLQKSYKAVTMKDIVDKTGLSKGAIYHYFDSKLAIFRVVAEQYYLSTQTDVYNGLPRENLYQFFQQYTKKLQTMINHIKQILNESGMEQTDINYLTLAFDAMRLIPGFRKKIKAGHEEELNIWTEVVNNAKSSGEISTIIDSEALARLFIYVNDGTGMHLMLESKLEDAPKELMELWEGLYVEIRG